jgi:hypothetical protein
MVLPVRKIFFGYDKILYSPILFACQQPPKRIDRLALKKGIKMIKYTLCTLLLFSTIIFAQSTNPMPKTPNTIYESKTIPIVNTNKKSKNSNDTIYISIAYPTNNLTSTIPTDKATDNSDKSNDKKTERIVATATIWLVVATFLLAIATFCLYWTSRNQNKSINEISEREIKHSEELVRKTAFWQLFVAAAKEFKDIWIPIRNKITAKFIENPPGTEDFNAMKCAIGVLYWGESDDPNPFSNLHRLYDSTRAFSYYLPKDRTDAFREAIEAVLGKGDKLNPHEYLEAKTTESEKEKRDELLKRIDNLIGFATRDA